MAQEVIVSVQRGAQHTPVPGLQSVPGRIVEYSYIIASGNGGAVPYFKLSFLSRVGVPDIRNGDLLTESVTSQQYRVSGTPIAHDSSYLSVELTRFPEVTP